MDILKLLKKNDIIYVGISEEERYKFKINDIEQIEENIWTMPYNKHIYIELKLQEELDSKNNYKFITDWMRSYAESITGRMSNPIYCYGIKIWDRDGNTIIYESYKTIIKHGYVGDFQNNKALTVEELILKIYYTD